MDTAKSLAEACATLVYQLDELFQQNTFPHNDPVVSDVLPKTPSLAVFFLCMF